MSDTTWGIIFVVYLAAALPIMGMGNGAAQRPKGLPGSWSVSAYDAREKRFGWLMGAWIVGLIALFVIRA